MDEGKGILRTAKRLMPHGPKAAALRAIRAYGVATDGLRSLPDFLIIGGKRCATTTLYWNLVEHPGVAPLFPRAKHIKGVHFFDWNFGRGVRWYRSHFPSAAYRSYARLRHGRTPIAGEASTSYLFHPHAPARAQQVAPEARLIVVVRNPVDRAWSHYRARVRHGREPLSFEEAIEAEPERLAGERERLLADGSYRSYPLEQQAYFSLGLYADPLAEWMNRFPRERVLVIRAEDLAGDPGRAYRSVLGFLDLQEWTPSTFRSLNVGPGSQDMSPETRTELQARFAPHNDRLARLLGLELGWDRS